MYPQSFRADFKLIFNVVRGLDSLQYLLILILAITVYFVDQLNPVLGDGYHRINVVYFVIFEKEYDIVEGDHVVLRLDLGCPVWLLLFQAYDEFKVVIIDTPLHHFLVLLYR